MKRTQAYTLTASLCLVAAAGCRDDPGSTNPPPATDMAMPTIDDLSVSPNDLTAPSDLTQQMPSDLAGVDMTLPPPPTEFMVVRVGDGSVVTSGATGPVFIEKHKLSDGSIVGTAIALPTAVSGANKRLTLAPANTSEGGLTLSEDGKYLVIAGYDAAPGTASISTSSGGTVNRVIGRVDGAGAIDTSTAANFFSGVGIRGAASTNGTDLWASGASGIVYTTLGNTATPASLLTSNMRWLLIAGGQLYGSSGAAGLKGASSIGTGVPKAAATATLLSGFSTETAASPYGLVAFNHVASADKSYIYIADQRSLASGGGVLRWSLSGTTWSLDGRLQMGLVIGGAVGVGGFQTATGVTLIVTTDETPPRVVSFVDDGSDITKITATQLIAGTANIAYRGVALPPTN